MVDVLERFRVGVTTRDGAYAQYALSEPARLREVGIYLGSDPASDVRIDDAEGWHVHVIERNGVLHADVISGGMRFGERELIDGETARLEAGSAIQIADATVTFGTAACAGVSDLAIAGRSNEPQALFETSRMLRVRVIRGALREVLELRPFLESIAQITVGSDPSCDVVVDGVARGAVTLAKGHWHRIGVGSDVIVQLCRWARRDETVRVLWIAPEP